MTTDLRVEPVSKWPGDLTIGRKDSPFSAGYSQTLDVLDRELHAVSAHAVVVQLAVGRDDLHTNALRQSLRPAHPGVILSFTSSRLGKVRFTCDRYWKWHDNLRAIALGMEALRKVDRYGITSDGQQYAGFRAIEAAESARGFETVEQAAHYVVMHALEEITDPDRIDRLADAVLLDGELLDTYYRRAARALHPDKGGTEVAMALLNAARAMIEKDQ